MHRKLFITATPEVRAPRRFVELSAKAAKSQLDRRVLADVQPATRATATRAEHH